MEEENNKNRIGKILLKIILIIVAIVLIINGVEFINKGFDVKDNYYQSSSGYSSLNKHAYVGGDAYNYIINANYFTGYIVLGSSLIICSAILVSTSLLIGNNKINYKEIRKC